MKPMDEEKFYNMCDIVESFNDVTGGYYPTVEELRAHNVEDNMETSLPFITYFASDPLRRAGSSDAEDKDYQETVKYCKMLMSRVELLDGES